MKISSLFLSFLCGVSALTAMAEDNVPQMDAAALSQVRAVEVTQITYNDHYSFDGADFAHLAALVNDRNEFKGFQFTETLNDRTVRAPKSYGIEQMQTGVEISIAKNDLIRIQLLGIPDVAHAVSLKFKYWKGAGLSGREFRTIRLDLITVNSTWRLVDPTASFIIDELRAHGNIGVPVNLGGGVDFSALGQSLVSGMRSENIPMAH